MADEVIEQTPNEESIEDADLDSSPDEDGKKGESTPPSNPIAELSDEDLERALAAPETEPGPESTPPLTPQAGTAPSPSSPSVAVPAGPSGEQQPPAATAEQLRIKELEKQNSEAQRFIARQAAEIGMARKGNPEEFIAKRKAIAEKFVSGTVEEVAAAQKELRQLEDDEKAHSVAVEREGKAAKIINVMQWMPNVLNLAPEMANVLIEEDKVNPALAQAAIQDMGGLGSEAAIFGLAKRAEARLKIKELTTKVSALEAENAILKGAKKQIVDGINRAARQPVPLKAGGGGGTRVAASKPAHELTDAELDAALKEQAS